MGHLFLESDLSDTVGIQDSLNNLNSVLAFVSFVFYNNTAYSDDEMTGGCLIMEQIRHEITQLKDRIE